MHQRQSLPLICLPSSHGWQQRGGGHQLPAADTVSELVRAWIRLAHSPPLYCTEYTGLDCTHGSTDDHLDKTRCCGELHPSVTGSVQVGRQRQRHRQAVEASSWLPKAGLQRFTTSEAGVFRLDNLERSPNGMLGGAGVLQCSDTKENVPISALVNVSGLVLYSVEVLDGEILLLFMQ
ncbi:unnamed protein product, partial [Sphacelaria rigidula]